MRPSASETRAAQPIRSRRLRLPVPGIESSVLLLISGSDMQLNLVRRLIVERNSLLPVYSCVAEPGDSTSQQGALRCQCTKCVACGSGLRPRELIPGQLPGPGPVSCRGSEVSSLSLSLHQLLRLVKRKQPLEPERLLVTCSGGGWWWWDGALCVRSAGQ